MGIFPTDSNYTIGSIAKLLHDLEVPPKNSLCMLFSLEDNQSTFTKVLLDGSKTFLNSLLPPPQEPLLVELLPPILILQLDNALGNKKNRWVFSFCSLFVYKGIFCEVYINFLIVEHAYKDIHTLFG